MKRFVRLFIAFTILSLGYAHAADVRGPGGSGSGSGTVTSSGTPLIHQMPVFTTATDVKGIGVCATGTYLRGATGADPLCSTLVLPNAATTGDLFYASGTDTMNVLSDVAVGAYLRSGGTATAPLWSTLILPDVGTLYDIPLTTATNTWGYDTGKLKYDVSTGTLYAPKLQLGTGSDPFQVDALEGTAPGNPASTFDRLYIDSTDHRFHDKNASGVIGTTVTASTCTNQFVSAISIAGVVTCTTDTLAGAQHANQGTMTTVLHGNASGNPAFGTVVNADLCAGCKARGITFELGAVTASAALTTSDAVYIVVPFKCTISASDMMIDAADATVSVDILRVATGATALPTASILTGGYLSVGSGAAVHNANTTLFASTAIAANDRVGAIIHAANTAKYVSVTLQCDATD